MIHLGDVPAGTTLYIPFTTYNSSGASVTISGLAVTDIEIYKNGSITQRASDNGYALLDTDGIDFDGITGLHGFSVDLSDNSDSGFFAAGSFYWVVVSTVTVDSQTVTLLAATFRIVAAESSAGTPKADVSHLAGSAVDASSGLINANVKQISGDATAADNAEAFFDGTGYAGTNNVIPTTTSVTNGVTVTTNNDKTGYRLSATGVDDIHDEVVEGSTTLRQSIRLNNAAQGGKASGMATTSVAVRDLADSKDRIAATVDSSGNRTAVTLDLT